jgi:hypothetical protein
MPPPRAIHFSSSDSVSPCCCCIGCRMIRGGEHEVRVGETPLLDPVNPNHKSRANGKKRRARRGRRADKVGDGITAGFDHAVAQPAHPLRMLNTVGLGKSEILVNVRPNLVGFKVHRVEPWRQALGQRGLAGARQAHDQDFSKHVCFRPDPCREEEASIGTLRASSLRFPQMTLGAG